MAKTLSEKVKAYEKREKEKKKLRQQQRRKNIKKTLSNVQSKMHIFQKNIDRANKRFYGKRKRR